MNFYKHHIGDYATATSHLSFIEDGAYSRLMRRYYSTEQPLPEDPDEVARVIGARTKQERAAVLAMLREFFELREDGWHQDRCDEEIASTQEAGGDAEVRKRNERERQRRHREERKHLFEKLRAAGVTMPFNTNTETLRSRVTSPNGHTPVTRDKPVTVTRTVTPVTPQATAIQTPDTKTPVAISQTPDSEPISKSTHTSGIPSPVRAGPEAEKGSVCGTFTKIGGEGTLNRPRPNGPIPSVDEVMDQLRKEHGRARK